MKSVLTMEEIDIYFIDETMVALWCCAFNIRMPLIVSRFAISWSKNKSKNSLSILCFCFYGWVRIIEKLKGRGIKGKVTKRILNSTFCEKYTRMLYEFSTFQKPKNSFGLRCEFLKMSGSSPAKKDHVVRPCPK